MKLKINKRTDSLMQYGCFIGLALCLSHCATPPPQLSTKEEQIRKEHFLGLKLAEQVEQEIPLKTDMEVSVYLRNLGLKLAQSNPDLSQFPLGVLTIEDKKNLRWINFALPGNRIYLSIGLIKKLEFENELAATIALEMGHLLKRHLITHLENHFPGLLQQFSESNSFKSQSNSAPSWLERKLSYRDCFDPGGVFDFSEESELKAIEAAIGILYSAGFDPRGLSGVLFKYKENPKYSPFEGGTTEKLIEFTRRSLAQYPPLRNPVVRSQAFISLLKRINQL